MIIHVALLGVVAAAILAYSIDFIFGWLDDPREPRRVAPRVPFFGHVVGFVLWGFEYYNFAGRNVTEEIYTIGFLNWKVYVTHSPRLLNAIGKTDTLSVKPILVSTNKIHSMASEDAHAIFEKDLYEDFRVRTREALAPGIHLDEQNLRMANQALDVITKTVRIGQMELRQWTEHMILQATSAGFYGMEHPFKDPALEDAMWNWDKYRPAAHIGLLDPLRRGHRARVKVVEALRKYFDNMPADVSQLVKERHRVLREGGITQEDALKIHSFLNDGNFNIVPTLEWVLYDIYSRPQLLGAIRQEIVSNAIRETDSGLTLDIASLKTQCPLLLSAWQETQRTRHSLSGSRYVVEDTLLAGQYLLKKNNLIYLPFKPIHTNPTIWGPQAGAYDPYRFMPVQAGKTDTRSKVLPSNFLPWGTPPYICPTRQFISTIIMVVMAVMVTKVDLTPERGSWSPEPAVRWQENATLPTTSEKMHFMVTERKYGSGSWTITTGKSKIAVPLVSG